MVEDSSDPKERGAIIAKQRKDACIVKTVDQLACQEEHDKIVGNRGEYGRMSLDEITHGGETSRCITIHVADEDGEASQKPEKAF